MIKKSRKKNFLHNTEHWEKCYVTFERRILAYENKTNDEACQMALIKSFEMSIESSRKALNYYFEIKKVKIRKDPSARTTFYHAFQEGLIENEKVWCDAWDKRNDTSHTYVDGVDEEILNFIQDTFRFAYHKLYQRLQQEQ